MVDILGAVLTDGLDAVEAACAEGPARGCDVFRSRAQHPGPAPRAGAAPDPRPPTRYG